MFSEEFIKSRFIPILETKRKNTYVERFGFEHPMKNKSIKEKARTACLLLDVNGNNAHDRRRITNEENGHWITEDQVKDFKDYTKLVWRYTNQNDLNILENIEFRAHTKEGYHLDHKYSIYQGFRDNISAKIIGNICNLEMLISGQNLSKNRKCSITKDDLLSNFKL